MAVFKLPDLGEGLTEAEVLRWLVAPGDIVTLNQPIVEVETAKAAVEVPSPYAGTVTTLHGEEGVALEVGAPLITIAVAGEAVPDQAPAPDPADGDSGDDGSAGDATAHAGGEAVEQRQSVLVGYGPRTASAKRRPRRSTHAAPARARTAVPAGPPGSPRPDDDRPEQDRLEPDGLEPETPVPAAAPEPAPLARHQTGDSSGGHSTASDRASAGHVGTARAKPPVRKLARELGVDLAALTASGPHGTVTREDVHAAAEQPGTQARSGSQVNGHGTAPHAAARDEVAGNEVTGTRRVPLTGMQRAMATAMVESATQAPHVTVFLTVDVTRSTELLARLKKAPELDGVRVTPLLLAARAVVLAALRFPRINARWDGDAVLENDQVNLGIAAATPRGLLVPNIKDAGALSLPDLGRALGALTATAREGRTSMTDLQQGTITLSNIGVFGVDTGTPILNPGETAILALGTIKPTPWVVDGGLAVRDVCQLSLSFDHRVADGELGSRVLAYVGRVLTDPEVGLLI